MNRRSFFRFLAIAPFAAPAAILAARAAPAMSGAGRNTLTVAEALQRQADAFDLRWALRRGEFYSLSVPYVAPGAFLECLRKHRLT